MKLKSAKVPRLGSNKSKRNKDHSMGSGCNTARTLESNAIKPISKSVNTSITKGKKKTTKKAQNIGLLKNGYQGSGAQQNLGASFLHTASL